MGITGCISSEGEHDIGFCDKVKHMISVSDERPMSLPFRRIAPNQWSEVESYLKAHLAAEIIRPSCSPYSDPLVLI